MSTRRTDPAHGNANETQAQDEVADESENTATGSVQVVDDRPQRKGFGGWAMSAGIHAMILLSMAFVVYANGRPKDFDAPPLARHDPLPIPLTPPHVDPTPTPPDQIPDPLADTDIVTPDAPVTPTVDESGNTDDIDAKDAQVDGNPTDLAVLSDSTSTNPFAVIGIGCGNPGPKGTPSSRRFGPKISGSHHQTRASESAVEAALRWFKRHQSADGGWEAVKYFANCTDGAKCEPGNAQDGNANPAMTGYALLCYIGAGYDHVTANHYRPVVRKGIEKLLSEQDQDGRFGPRNYEHAIATMALAEAYAVTMDPALKTPCQRAVNVILAAQNQDDDKSKDVPGTSTSATGLGWDYGAASGRNDASVSGWNIMALKSAYAAGLNVGDGLNGAKRWLERSWKATNPGWAKLDPYTGESRFPYVYNTVGGAVQIAAAPAPGAPSPDSQDLSCVGLTCAIFLGHHAGDPMLESLANYISDHDLPKAWPTNTYKMYYNTLSMFQVGGKRFDAWDDKCRDMLVAAQRKSDDGCFAGSWDWTGTVFPGNNVGRVMSTALCCLTLEVYYRHEKLDIKADPKVH